MKIETISSPHNPRFKLALSLHTSRGRRRHNRILVIGEREVTRALKMDVEFEDLFFDAAKADHEDLSWPKTRFETDYHAVRQYWLTPVLFQRLSFGNRDSSVIGVTSRPDTGLKQLLPDTDESLIIVLESLEKPGNLGAVVRSADASGCDAICLANPKTDIFHPNSIRASMATVFSIPIATGTSQEIQQWLKKHGYRTFLASPNASKNLYQTKMTGRVAVVFGSEAGGLSQCWDTNNEIQVSLPMLGINDSLNVSVTASLFMYERLRQLKNYRVE